MDTVPQRLEEIQKDMKILQDLVSQMPEVKVVSLKHQLNVAEEKTQRLEKLLVISANLLQAIWNEGAFLTERQVADMKVVLEAGKKLDRRIDHASSDSTSRSPATPD